MICNICQRAGDYYSEYKNKNEKFYLENAQQMHWLCINKPSGSDNCFCGHRAEEIIQT